MLLSARGLFMGIYFLGAMRALIVVVRLRFLFVCTICSFAVACQIFTVQSRRITYSIDRAIFFAPGFFRDKGLKCALNKPV